MLLEGMDLYVHVLYLGLNRNIIFTCPIPSKLLMYQNEAQ